MAKKITIRNEGNMVFFTVLSDKYRTNKNGEGLWKWEKTGAWADHMPVYDWKQILGTCQFSLPQKTRGGKRAAIERYFADELRYNGWLAKVF